MLTLEEGKWSGLYSIKIKLNICFILSKVSYSLVEPILDKEDKLWAWGLKYWGFLTDSLNIVFSRSLKI